MSIDMGNITALITLEENTVYWQEKKPKNFIIGSNLC